MKLIQKFSILFLLLFIFQNDKAFSNSDDEVLIGLNYVYDLKFDEAESVFKQIQKKYPADLKGYFYESLLYFYKALPSRDKSMLDKFTELSDNVIMKAEDILDKDENNPDALYYKGVSHSYRSLLLLNLNESLLKAASDGNEGYRILTELIKIKPDYYDAYMGLGLYKIALGFVPDKFKWLLSLIGFDGNIFEGMSMLKKSMNKGKFTVTDSKVFLCLFSLKEKEISDNTSLMLSKELSDNYPESPVFKILYSGMLLQSGHNSECIKSAEDALSLNKFSFQKEIVKSANALLGTANFRENNFAEAVIFYEESIKNMNIFDRFNVHIFSAGVAFELAGNRSKALEYYSKVRSDFINERDGEAEKFFYRYATVKLKNPITEIERADILGMNLRESLKLDEAIKEFEDALKQNLLMNASNDEKIRFYFDFGLTHVYKNESDKAVKLFEKCISIKPDNELWILPHAYFELGKIYDRQNNRQKSDDMFDEIFSYDDYDFKNFLEMRLANYLNNRN